MAQSPKIHLLSKLKIRRRPAGFENIPLTASFLLCHMFTLPFIPQKRCPSPRTMRVPC